MNISFVNITFCFYFSSEEVLQGLEKNNPNKKQIDAEIQGTLKHAPVQKLTEEKMFYSLSHRNKLQKKVQTMHLNVFSINFAIYIIF